MNPRDRIELRRQLKDAVETHAEDSSQYPKASEDAVIQSVLDSGYDEEVVEGVLESLLREGELYQTGGGKLGRV